LALTIPIVTVDQRRKDLLWPALCRHFKLIAVGHGDCRKILSFDFYDGYVRVWISTNDSSVTNRSHVTERNFDFVGAAHHVVAGENVTVLRYYETGTDALLAALSRDSIVTIGVTKELPEKRIFKQLRKPGIFAV